MHVRLQPARYWSYALTPLSLNVVNDESTADLILKSCNAQSFFVHKDILDAYSGTFADAGDCSSSGEPARQTSNQETVECTETGETLGYLLRFMYRNGVRPDLEVMSIVQLSALVDAAEKYDVFAIKDILWVYMRYVWQCLSSSSA